MPSPVNLSQEDLQALRLTSLKDYRYLTCHHLAGLVYGSRALCQARMEKLAQNRLVSRLDVPSTDGRMQQEPVYTLAPKGALVLTDLSREDPAGLSASKRTTSYLFLQHGLAITEFRHAVEMAVARRLDVRLSFWRNEWEIRKFHGKRLTVPVPAGAGEPLQLVPDGVFGPEVGSRGLYYFLEIDRGTMGLKSIQRKLWAYIRFYKEGLHKRYFRIGHFRVAMVTTTQARMDRMLRMLKAIGLCLNMFLFTTYHSKVDRKWVANVSPERILEPIWRRCKDGELRSLLV